MDQLHLKMPVISGFIGICALTEMYRNRLAFDVIWFYLQAVGTLAGFLFSSMVRIRAGGTSRQSPCVFANRRSGVEHDQQLCDRHGEPDRVRAESRERHDQNKCCSRRFSQLRIAGFSTPFLRHFCEGMRREIGTFMF